MYVYMCTSAWRTEEGMSYPGNIVTGSVSHPTWYWALNPTSALTQWVISPALGTRSYVSHAVLKLGVKDDLELLFFLSPTSQAPRLQAYSPCSVLYVPEDQTQGFLYTR